MPWLPRPPTQSSWTRARLILGDQLNSEHSWVAAPCPHTLILFMELRCESEYVTHHVQKIATIFAAMRSFARELSERGFHVHYTKITDQDNAHEFEANLARILRDYEIERLEYQLPDEYRLDEQFKALAGKLKIDVQPCDTEHFLTSRHEVGEFFSGKKSWLMESFYRAMRKKHNVLMDAEQKPLGGQWNFDQENRKKLPKGHRPPPPLALATDAREVMKDIRAAKLPYIGRIDEENLDWPVTKAASLQLLDDFLARFLPNFGLYQDALSDEFDFIYHSRISQALNLKLISPQEVIDRALAAFKQRPEQISLPQIEGFIRQILGWREYVRGVYWHHMPGYAQENGLEHTRALPGYFWDGGTKMRCVQRAIEQSLQHGYAHHIQRLMVTGNFCALAGIDPAEVDRWYLGIYVDAFEWVQLPNTRGMSQYADMGRLATKPYVSSANYLNKMGDHCKACHYDHKLKHETKACPFNSLYWHFLDQHKARLRANPRMGMMYRQFDKLADKDKILARARSYLSNIEDL